MFKGALTAVVSSEFADVPNNDDLIDIRPSINFKKKMEKLIKKEKRVVWRYTNTAYKRVAILVAVLVMMFATACSVSAIREPIVEFFTEVYESFTRYFFEGDTVTNISNVFELTNLPDGFEIRETTSGPLSITTIYENGDGHIIELSQAVTDDTRFTLDSENGTIKEIQMEGKTIHLYSRADVSQAMWIEQGYLLTLTYEGDVSEDVMIKLISSLTTKK